MIDTQKPLALVFLNLGAPKDMASIEPFLYELFADPDLVQLPLSSLLQKPFAKLISKLRTPKVAGDYQAIGGGSPLIDITERLASKLETYFHNHGMPKVSVHLAMRCSPPRAQDVVQELKAKGIDQVMLVSLYPQFSHSTTGSSVKEFRRVAREEKWRGAIHIVGRYPTHPSYIRAMAEKMREKLREADQDTVLLFSAHSLPEKYIKQGDPYLKDIQKTTQALLEATAYQGKWKLCFQSQAGPAKWLGPQTDDVLKDLGEEGVKSVCLVPIAFVSEHFETLYEIDQLFAGIAKEAGIERFLRVPALDDSDLFVEALYDLVFDKFKWVAKDTVPLEPQSSSEVLG